MHASPNRVPYFLFYFSTVSKVLRQKEKFLYSNDGSQSPPKKAKGKSASAGRAKNKQTKGKSLNNSKIGKKLTNDREAQRAIRGRRKPLKQQVPELTERKKKLERQVTEFAEGKEQLEGQIAALQCQQDRESLMGPEYTGTAPACGTKEDQREQKRAEDRETQRERTRECGERLEQRVADQNERLSEALQRISELEAQMAALQQITAQGYGTSPCILHSAPRPGR